LLHNSVVPQQRPSLPCPALYSHTALHILTAMLCCWLGCTHALLPACAAYGPCTCLLHCLLLQVPCNASLQPMQQTSHASCSAGLSCSSAAKPPSLSGPWAGSFWWGSRGCPASTSAAAQRTHDVRHRGRCTQHKGCRYECATFDMLLTCY
jgi:hypothetical protein